MTETVETKSPAITQEMINLYDEYTHLTLDRRGFMDKLGRLAGGSAAAAAIVPMLAADKAHAAVFAPDDARIVTERVSFPSADETELSGLLAKPKDAAGKLPAVLVIHENRGLNPHIEDVTRRFATEGFLALGIDLLSRSGGTPADEDQARNMIGKLAPEASLTDAIAAVEYLKANPASNGKVGVIGFCWGGGLVNRIAVAAPDLAAGVAYYGMQPPAGDVPKIKAKLMLHYAGLDDRINAGIPAYEAALKSAGVDYQVFVYEGANHAFNNDTSAARYDKKAADLAWSRTVAFLKANLG
ncbi:dienelactone hydrolase family protein [Kaistia dalseonensis]|uniref:Carboxymethylenebutenolidase n=1 Tax=Kaistia dalseonensis TaxID=410840 RepID=A0ABU0H609_9HYPH|nr:dienelactone hydrolase family protein [Kaistia dalseonensis]MCX5495170.1 dienelactone hydrolase family protein [Kaistia dalseonensis]MDQ0437753.1 carboxymethylenebutenolidase [Kaistia dalseonensis]